MFKVSFCDHWVSVMCRASYGNGVVRALKMLRTSKGDYCIKQWFSSSRPFSKWKLLLKERGSEFFPLSAVSYSMGNHLYHIADLP